MILDSSALIAILLREAGHEQFVRAINTPQVNRLSVAGYLEVAIYLDRNLDERRRAMLDSFIREFEIRLEPVTIEQIQIARRAFILFGKGRHKAGLNFGDCFTYALATAYSEPVLYKGNDFAQTDLESVAGLIQ